MRIDVWHGTNQNFDSFDRQMLGLNTNNTTSRQAFFFSGRPDTAWEYATFAARNLVPDQVAHERQVAELIERAAAAERRRDFDLYEELTAAAEELEFTAIHSPASGETLLSCRLEIRNALEVEASDPRMTSGFGDILQEAKAAGHDCVIVRNMSDTPSGACQPDDHYALFNTDLIAILDRYHSLEQALAETGTELASPDLFSF